MPKWDPGTVAEYRIDSLGISSPQDIDVEAIAFDAGLEVRYEELTSCAATLVGFDSRGIATVRPSGNAERDRFSVAHELGHWDLHRGKSFVCRVDDAADSLAAGVDKEKERQADDYAAHLLMPGRLFKPIIKELKQPGFAEIREVGKQFQSSLLATSLRVVGVGTEPAFLINYDAAGNKRWYRRADNVPGWWSPGSKVHEDSYSADVLLGKDAPPRPRKQPAELWFAKAVEDLELLEHCVRYQTGVLTVLCITDASML